MEKQNNKKSNSDYINYNERIRSSKCRVIEEGSKPKLMNTTEAIEYAKSKDLDLVEIFYDKEQHCSVCKIIDYSKYVYEMKKREKNAKKQARANKVETKTIQISLTIDKADLDRMIKRGKEFLDKGNKLKLSLRFHNKREIENIEYAKNVMKNTLNEFNNLAVLDSNVTLSGRELACVLRPIKK